MRTTRTAILMFATAVGMSAATSTPPFDYFVSLYQWPSATTVPGGTMEQVIVYLGNNAFEGAAPAGQPFNAYMRVMNASGQQVCVAEDAQLPPIPTGKSWGAYAFQVTYPKRISNLGGKVAPKTTTYTVSAAINPEHPDADTNHSNQAATKSFTFRAGGTSACVTLPRPTFHQ